MTPKNDNILNFIRRREYKRRLDEHEIWGHVDGRIYSLAKILFSIAFALAMLVNVTYLIYWCNLFFSEHDSLANPGGARNAITIVFVMSALLVADYLLIFRKKWKAYIPCTIVPCIILPIHFYGEMSDIISGGGMTQYIYKHAVWYLVMVIAMVIMLIIQLRENAKENREYAVIEAALYKKASASADKSSVFSEGDWEKILDKFDEGTIGDAKPKRRTRGEDNADEKS